jgi:hypothetical protein
LTIEASHRGHTSRGFTTSIPHCGHLRVRAIGAKVEGTRVIRQRCFPFENRKVIHNQAWNLLRLLLSLGLPTRMSP